MRRTTATARLAACLAVAGCSTEGGGEPEPKDTVTVTSSPTLSREEAQAACVDAWLDVMTADDYDPDAGLNARPAVCQDLPGQAEMYAEALRERNAENRGRLDECLEDPACTEFPVG